MTKIVADQADGLRRLMAGNPGQVVAVVGGGPKVGVTSVAVNLAAALAQQGKHVLLLDERNGLPPNQAQREERLVLIDTLLDTEGALSPMAARADHVLVVLQPTAASITASYACIKRLHYAHALQRMRVLVNCATSTAEAGRVVANLAHTGSRYLALALEPAGTVRADPCLAQARRLNLAVVDAFQTSPAATDFRQIASELLRWPWRPQDGCLPQRVAAMPTGHEGSPALEMQ